MNTWVLIIAIFGQDGNWVRQYTEGPINTQQECAQRAANLKFSAGGSTFKGICVTHDHWTGKTYMPNVALD